jgi:hypothetical protein
VQARDNVSNVAAPAADLDVTTAAYSSVLGAGDAVRVCQHRLWVADSNATAAAPGRRADGLQPGRSRRDRLHHPGRRRLVGHSHQLVDAGVRAVTYNPTVNKASGAVLRIGKRTATTDSVGCCYAALQVEYGPATNAQRFLAVA